MPTNSVQQDGGSCQRVERNCCRRFAELSHPQQGMLLTWLSRHSHSIHADRSRRKTQNAKFFIMVPTKEQEPGVTVCERRCAE